MTFYYLMYYFCSVLFSGVLSLIVYQLVKRKLKGPRAVFLSALAFAIPFLIHMMKVAPPLRLALLLILLPCLACYTFAFYVAWDRQRDIRIFGFNDPAKRRRAIQPRRPAAPAKRAKELKKRVGSLASQMELAAAKLTQPQMKEASSETEPLSDESEAASEAQSDDEPDLEADSDADYESDAEPELDSAESDEQASIFSVSEFVDSASPKLGSVIKETTGRSVSSGQSKGLLVGAVIAGALLLIMGIFSLGSSDPYEYDPYDPYDVYHDYSTSDYQYSASSDVYLTEEMLSQGADQCARILGFADFQQLALHTTLTAEPDWELLTCEEQFDRYAADQSLASYGEILGTQDPYSKKDIFNYLGYMDYCTNKLLQRSGRIDEALQRSYHAYGDLTRQRFDAICRLLGYDSLDDFLNQYSSSLYDDPENSGYPLAENPEEIVDLLAGELDAMPYYEALFLYDPDQGFAICDVNDYQLFLINSARHYAGLPLQPFGQELEGIPVPGQPADTPEADLPEGSPTTDQPAASDL